MKAWIYIICFFVLVMIQIAINNAGVLLGAIPTVLLYLGTFSLARWLCKLWDNSKD